MQELIRLIKEFLIFRNMMKQLDIAEITPQLKYALKSENSEIEKEINKVLMYNLARRVIRENIPHEFAAWFKSALSLRVSLKSLKEVE